jgi:hypothetical protein
MVASKKRCDARVRIPYEEIETRLVEGIALALWAQLPMCACNSATT